MNISAGQFPLFIEIISWLIVAALSFASINNLRKYNPSFRHYIISVIIIALLWGMHGSISFGLDTYFHYHLLAATLIFLILGFYPAFILFTLFSIIYILKFQQFNDIRIVGIYILLAILPALLFSKFSLKISQKLLPHNIFIFIFVNSFFTAAIAMMLSGSISLFALDIANIYSKELIWHRAFPVFFLLSWAEAFFTGFMSAVFVAISPHLLESYSDEIYIAKNNSIL